jgi:hypothetical protein
MTSPSSDDLEYEQAIRVYRVVTDKMREALEPHELGRLIGEVPDDVSTLATVMALIHYAIFLRVILQMKLMVDGTYDKKDFTDDKEDFMEMASDLYDDFHWS